MKRLEQQKSSIRKYIVESRFFMNSEQEYYISLIDRLRQLPVETEWLEYKMNNYEPELIGEYISALSNSATICNKEKAYILWVLSLIPHKI